MSTTSLTTAEALPSGVAGARVFYAASGKSTGRGKFRVISDEFRLDGRVCLVTGANSGLGLEIALVFAELGAKVWGVDLSNSASEDFKSCDFYAKALRKADNPEDEVDTNLPSLLVYRRADVADEYAIRQVCQEIVTTDGRLDVCVAAAGVCPPPKSCTDTSAAEFEKVMKVNSTGVFNTATVAAEKMVELCIPGSIILIASMLGSLANQSPPVIAYNTSKAAVLQMGRSMACELGQHKIRVNTLSPGYLRTAMTAGFLEKMEATWSASNPLGRIGESHEVRGVVAWLASDASTFCTGSDIVVSGGHHAW